MYGHLGAMSGMSPLIPVPFDFLSGGCWVMVQARKDRFRVEQAAAGTRPPPQCQPGSLCSFAPLLSALLLSTIPDYGRQLVEHSQLDLVSSRRAGRRQRWLLGQMPAGALCSATYQPEKVRPENAFNHSWDRFLLVLWARISWDIRECFLFVLPRRAKCLLCFS